LCGAALSHAQTAQKCVVPPPGIVSWWTGDGHANDIAGNNHGSLENGATFSAGLVGDAFQFDGLNAFVLVPSDASLTLAKFTVDFWFNSRTPFGPQTSASPRFLGKGFFDCGGFTCSFSVDLANNDGRLEVSGPDPRPFSTTNTWLANTWYHIAVTFDGFAYRIFVNGAEEGGSPTPSSVSILDNDNDLTLGGEAIRPVTFDGLVDEVEIFDRALSEAEIAAIHAAGAAGKCKLRVAINIKPGSDPNSINKGSAGVIPVAILGSSGFDPSTIDPSTIDLAGAGVRLVGKDERPLCHIEDVNGDGFSDLVCQVYTWQFLVEEGVSTAVLRASTYGGLWMWGEDSVRIVP